MKKRKVLTARVLFFVIFVCCLVPVYIVLKPEKGNTSSDKKLLEAVAATSTHSPSPASTQTSLTEQSVKTRTLPGQTQAAKPGQTSKTDTAEIPDQSSEVKAPAEEITEHAATKAITPPREKADQKQAQEIYVRKSVVCPALDNRNPVDPRNVFVVGQDRAAISWTEIRASNLPTRITHVYYLNGEKYCEVSLAVKYPRTRTWSKISLIDENQVGSWEVVVMEETGNILKQMAFDVKSEL